jgi:uncharacterized protein
MQPEQLTSEKPVTFNSGALKIEGLFTSSSTEKGVVVTHPHPLYGGDMLNNVVEALCHAYNKCGYSSLRFNFRGAGGSEGAYDNGNGEQDDMEAAVRYLVNSGIKKIDLAGYSFGSWVIALGIKKLKNINRLVMVSPPVDLFDYSSAYNAPETGLIIAGSEDDIADWRSIEKVLPLFNQDVTLKVIQGADHFYWGKSDDLMNIVMEFLK